MFKLGKRSIAITAAAAFALSLGTAMPAQAATTITWLVDDGQATQAVAKQLVIDFQKANPSIKVKLQTRPGGANGDNIVKTKLATNTMADVFGYNSGALLAALNPAKTLLDLTNLPIQKNVYDSYKPAVMQGGKVYGLPQGATGAGGIYYNADVFKANGITSTPKTWAELMTIAKKIKAAGTAPFCGTFADTWTAQLLVLADYYNVQSRNPKFTADYTANKQKYATNAAARAGFERLQETHDLDLYQTGSATATFPDAIGKIQKGDCAMYPMLTFFTTTLDAANQQKIGFFAQPGNYASDYGLTLWMPSANYIPKNTKHKAEAIKLVSFISSKAGSDSQVKGGGYTGPFVTKDQSPAPAGVPLSIKQLAAMVKTGKTAPALEFVSPIKGPNLPNITAQVATGQVTAKQAATAYDKDVEAQAKQLGIKGW